jgi:hypothetical protein
MRQILPFFDSFLGSNCSDLGFEIGLLKQKKTHRAQEARWDLS